MRVYIAGPLTSNGDMVVNTRRAVKVANEVRDLGHFPFVPHLCTFWQYLYERSYADWMAYCIEWLGQCEAMVRIPGESKGVDIEEEYCKNHDIPVYSPTDFLLKCSLEDNERKTKMYQKAKQGISDAVNNT